MSKSAPRVTRGGKIAKRSNIAASEPNCAMTYGRKSPWPLCCVTCQYHTLPIPHIGSVTRYRRPFFGVVLAYDGSEKRHEADVHGEPVPNKSVIVRMHMIISGTQCSRGDCAEKHRYEARSTESVKGEVRSRMSTAQSEFPSSRRLEEDIGQDIEEIIAVTPKNRRRSTKLW